MESAGFLTSVEIQIYVRLCFPVTSFPYLEKRAQCMHSVVVVVVVIVVLVDITIDVYNYRPLKRVKNKHTKNKQTKKKTHKTQTTPQSFPHFHSSLFSRSNCLCVSEVMGVSWSHEPTNTSIMWSSSVRSILKG